MVAIGPLGRWRVLEKMRRSLRMSREIIFYVEAPVQRARGGHESGPGNVSPRCEFSVGFEIIEFAQRILTQNIYKLREFRMGVEI